MLPSQEWAPRLKRVITTTRVGAIVTERITTITATELRRDLANLLDQIMIYRESISITRQGKTIAFLVPAPLEKK